LFFLIFFLPRGPCCSPFPVPSNLCPLDQSKQLTLLTHETSPRHRRPPPSNTHNSLTPGSVTAVGSDGPGPVDGNPGVRECRTGPGRPSVMDPSSVTDGRSEFIYMIIYMISLLCGYY
jgi:hypothetical protein